MSGLGIILGLFLLFLVVGVVGGLAIWYLSDALGAVARRKNPREREARDGWDVWVWGEDGQRDISDSD